MSPPAQDPSAGWPFPGRIKASQGGHGQGHGRAVRLQGRGLYGVGRGGPTWTRDSPPCAPEPTSPPLPSAGLGASPPAPFGTSQVRPLGLGSQLSGGSGSPGPVAQHKQTHCGSLPATPPPQGWPNTGLIQHMLSEDLLCGKHSTRHVHKTGKSLALWGSQTGGGADRLCRVPGRNEDYKTGLKRGADILRWLETQAGSCVAFRFYPECEWEATGGGCHNQMRKPRFREGQ